MEEVIKLFKHLFYTAQPLDEFGFWRGRDGNTYHVTTVTDEHLLNMAGVKYRFLKNTAPSQFVYALIHDLEGLEYIEPLKAMENELLGSRILKELERRKLLNKWLEGIEI